MIAKLEVLPVTGTSDTSKTTWQAQAERIQAMCRQLTLLGVVVNLPMVEASVMLPALIDVLIRKGLLTQEEMQLATQSAVITSLEQALAEVRRQRSHV